MTHTILYQIAFVQLAAVASTDKSEVERTRVGKAEFHESLAASKCLNDSCPDISIVRLPFRIHRCRSSVRLLGAISSTNVYYYSLRNS